jgi:CRP-like cAMP-binding protein
MTMSLTTERKIPLLRGVALFDDIGPEGLAMIAERAVEVDFAEGRTIVRQGEVGTGFFLITSGAARVVRDGQTIAEDGPGDFFGELSLLDGGPRIASVVASAPTTCLALASWEFEALLESQPRLAIAILKGVARRLRDVSEEHRH